MTFFYSQDNASDRLHGITKISNKNDEGTAECEDVELFFRKPNVNEPTRIYFTPQELGENWEEVCRQSSILQKINLKIEPESNDNIIDSTTTIDSPAGMESIIINESNESQDGPLDLSVYQTKE